MFLLTLSLIGLLTFTTLIIAFILIIIKQVSKPFMPIINDFTYSVFDLLSNPTKSKEDIMFFLTEPAKSKIIDYIENESAKNKKYTIKSIKINRIQSNFKSTKLSANVYIDITDNQKTIPTKNQIDYILEKNTYSKYNYVISQFSCVKTKIINKKPEKKSDPYH
jgi:hypothetical protein